MRLMLLQMIGFRLSLNRRFPRQNLIIIRLRIKLILFTYKIQSQSTLDILLQSVFFGIQQIVWIQT